MPYPRRLLNEGEEIALDIHPHWWFLSRQVAALVLTGVGFLWLWAVLGDSWWEKAATWIVGILALVSLIWTGMRWLEWRTTHFVITSDRLIARRGVLAKSGIEIPLERVNNVSFRQSIFERLIDAGDLLIESGGEEGQQRFSDIKKPDEVQNMIHTQKDDYRRRAFPSSTPSVDPLDVVSRLERLEGLRDRGTISSDEFEREKRRILDQ